MRNEDHGFGAVLMRRGLRTGKSKEREDCEKQEYENLMGSHEESMWRSVLSISRVGQK